MGCRTAHLGKIVSLKATPIRFLTAAMISPQIIWPKQCKTICSASPFPNCFSLAGLASSVHTGTPLAGQGTRKVAVYVSFFAIHYWHSLRIRQSAKEKSINVRKHALKAGIHKFVVSSTPCSSIAFESHDTFSDSSRSWDGASFQRQVPQVLWHTAGGVWPTETTGHTNYVQERMLW